MLNIYSPVVQNMYDINNVPGYVTVSGPPAYGQEGFPVQTQTIQVNNGYYGQQNYYQQPMMQTGYYQQPVIQQNYYQQQLAMSNGYYQQPIVDPNMNQQQRTDAANNLKRELVNPIIDYGMPYYNNGYGTYFTNQQPTTQVVQGFNPLGVDCIASADFNEKMDKLNGFYNDAVADMRNQGVNYGYNYYGYMNSSGIDYNVINQYNDAKKSLEEESKQNRIDLNKQISKMAHSYLGDYDEEYINNLYNDRVIQYNTPMYSMEWREANQLSRLVDITEYCKKAVNEAHRKVTERHNSIVNPNDNIGEFFDEAGGLLWQEAYDKLEHDRRNYSRFDIHEFNAFLTDQLSRVSDNRHESKNAIEALIQTFPADVEDTMNLPEGMSILEDGTISIRKPERLYTPEDYLCKDQVATFVIRRDDSIQKEYREQRENFYNSIYNGRSKIPV